MNRPALAITMGDPAGVGPELCLKALADPRVLDACVPAVVGSASVLEAAAARLRIPLDAPAVSAKDAAASPFDCPIVIDLANIAPPDFAPGTGTAATGRAAYEYVLYAIEQTKAARFAAMTTAPISKEALHAAGIRFPGHTEILEHETGSSGGVMMLTSPAVTVSLVTTHVALRDVPPLLSPERVERVIRLTREMMARLLRREPRLAVLAFNCHAGEGGLFGDEEPRAIVPAIDAARADGIDVAGPLPPDTAFTRRALKRFDAHVCMYHDQGLIPFKTLSFEEGVNVTLGIPIVRTSVDHGTAFDIAWQGKADPSSLVSAILLAARLAESG